MARAWFGEDETERLRAEIRGAVQAATARSSSASRMPIRGEMTEESADHLALRAPALSGSGAASREATSTTIRGSTPTVGTRRLAGRAAATQIRDGRVDRAAANRSAPLAVIEADPGRQPTTATASNAACGMSPAQPGIRVGEASVRALRPRADVGLLLSGSDANDEPREARPASTWRTSAGPRSTHASGRPRAITARGCRRDQGEREISPDGVRAVAVRVCACRVAI